MPKKQAAAEQPQLMTEDSADEVVLNVEVLDPAKPIVAYNPIRAAIEELTKKYGKLIFDVSTTKGLDDAKAARMAIREPRYKVERIRKALKAPALAYSRRIDDEAADYTAKLTALEKPIDEQIKARETAIEQEKAAKAAREAAERRRVEQALADLQFYVVEAAGKSIERMQELHAELTAKELTAEEFGDRLPEAVLARNTTANRLQGMIDTAVAAAAEAQRLAEEAERQRQAREDLERQQRELQRQQQELAAQQAAAAPPEQDDSKPFADAVAKTGAPEEMLRTMALRESAEHGAAPAGHFRYIDRNTQPASLVEVAAATGEVQHLGDIDDSDPFGAPQIPGFDVAASGDAEDHNHDAMRVSLMGVLDATDDEPATPTLSELVEIIADEYDVDDETAERWLRAAVAGA